jgi:hypothetical protein
MRATAAAASAAVLLAASAGSAMAATGHCDVQADCTFTTNVKGKSVSFDFRGLCNPLADYQITDVQDHTYYAQICGTAAQACLPQNWETEYQYGHVIQTWASAPTCDPVQPACVDPNTGNPTCCTAPCEVVAVQSAQFSLLDANDASAGLQITYIGETPTKDDPNNCDKDANGNYYPRVTQMQFFCDVDQTGYANLYEAGQAADDDCLYTLKFKTALACVDVAMSGGWIFVTIVLSVFAAYAVFGALWGYHKTRTWAFPNAAFWTEANELIFEGVVFAVHGCRKPAKSAMAGSKYAGIGTDGGVGSSTAAEASAPAFAGSAGGSGYQGNPAYTNL